MSESTETTGTVSSYHERTVGRIFDLYLHDEVGEPDNYLEWFSLLRTCTSNDTVYIHINSFGGYVATAIQLMKAIKESQAIVITSVEGMCLSAATMIFLCADICEVTDHSQFMIHTYSGAVFGKGSEMLAQVMHDGEWVRSLSEEVYADFLTQQEIDQMLDGKDFWFSSDDVIKRLKNRLKTQKTKAKQ